MTWTSISCWRSRRASQNPSRPASKATQTRRTTRPAPPRLLAPAVDQFEQLLRVRRQLLQRIARQARRARGDQPTRLAHFDDDDQRAILIQGGERLAQIDRFGHGALHRGCNGSDGALFLAARPIASLPAKRRGEEKAGAIQSDAA